MSMTREEFVGTLASLTSDLVYETKNQRWTKSTDKRERRALAKLTQALGFDPLSEDEIERILVY